MILKSQFFAGIETIGELLTRLGGIPAGRVRWQPRPGTATEKDLLALEIPCELVDGTLVEKAVGFYESRVGSILGYLIETFLEKNDLGITTGEQGPYRLMRGIVRMPDVGFVSWDQMPKRVLPAGEITNLYPDLAIEVLSKGNTRAETLRKRHEYFRVGTRLVWEIHATKQTVSVYTAPRRFTRVEAGGFLDGADVLPGFRLSLKDLFARVRVPAPRRRRS